MTTIKEFSSKDKLIAAAVKLMYAHGFESVGIHSILELADVSKSNFYYHFDSKEELCLAALDSMIQTFFLKKIDPVLLNKKLSPKERFQKLFENAEGMMEKSSCSVGCPFMNLAAETSDFYPSFRSRLASFYQEYKTKLAGCYEEGVKTGEFTNKISSDMAAQLVLSLINGNFLSSKVQKDVSTMQVSTKALFRLILN